jgi:AsmA protein
LKFKYLLGLPPFGIVGIPMKITGPGQNPKIKVGNQEEMDDTAN